LSIRKATVNDIPKIREIINYHAKKEMMLPRSLSELYECTRSFYVYEIDGEIVGCCALQVSWEELAEVMSLAVKPENSKQGIGSKLVLKCMEDAKDLEVKKVFTLTYATPFFEKMGFHIVDKQALPHKVWSACLKCSKFPDCDETALIKEI
jgi:amino-acid N-acetyltransferase